MRRAWGGVLACLLACVCLAVPEAAAFHRDDWLVTEHIQAGQWVAYRLEVGDPDSLIEIEQQTWWGGSATHSVIANWLVSDGEFRGGGSSGQMSGGPVPSVYVSTSATGPLVDLPAEVEGGGGGGSAGGRYLDPGVYSVVFVAGAEGGDFLGAVSVYGPPTAQITGRSAGGGAFFRRQRDFDAAANIVVEGYGGTRAAVQAGRTETSEARMFSVFWDVGAGYPFTPGQLRVEGPPGTRSWSSGLVPGLPNWISVHDSPPGGYSFQAESVDASALTYSDLVLVGAGVTLP